MAVVTTSGNDATEALNLSHTSNLSSISDIMPEEFMTKEFAGASNEFKDLVNKELKNMELAEQMEKQKELEKMRLVAKQKAEKLWCQRKEMEQAKVEAEWKKQEEIKMEQERKKQEEIELANQWKLHEEKLKSELRSQIQLKCQKEKEMLEMNSIKEKSGSELKLQVRKEMGLPTKKTACTTFARADSPHVC